MDIYEKNIVNLNRQLSPKAVSLRNSDNLGRPDSIVVAGMGGSGVVANLLQNLSEYANIKVPITSWKDYGLPNGRASKNPLYLFVSFSGNTQETISGFLKAKAGLKAVVSSGGKLTALAKKSKTPLASFAQDELAPRQANGLMFYGALGIIKKALPETKVEDLSKKINPEKYREAGWELAKKLNGKTALIYTSNQNSHIGYLWKIHLNETAKMLAFNNVLPEMNHNEIVPFEARPEKVAAIFLKDKNDSKEIRKRFEITDKILRNFGVPTFNLEVKGNPLENTFTSLTLAEWTSYHLAKLRGLDPLKTEIIDQIKKLI